MCRFLLQAFCGDNHAYKNNNSYVFLSMCVLEWVSRWHSGVSTACLRLLELTPAGTGSRETTGFCVHIQKLILFRKLVCHCLTVHCLNVIVLFLSLCVEMILSTHLLVLQTILNTIFLVWKIVFLMRLH